MTTEAGKRLLADLAGDTEGTVVLDAYRSGLAHDIAAIEAEAVAARNAEIAEAVRGLPLRGIFGEGPGAEVVGRRRVLEIIEKP